MNSAVTFDFHNTLVRCDPWFDLEVRTLPSGILRLLEDAGTVPHNLIDPDHLERTYRQLRSEIIGHGLEMDAAAGTIESFRRLGHELTSSNINLLIDELFRNLVSESQLIDGAKDTVMYLADRGITVAVISSAVHHDFLNWTLEFHDLRQAFQTISTSASTGYYKSRPEIYLNTFAELNVVPERIVHVGDSFQFDHLAGAAVGAQTVWLNEPGVSAPAGEVSPVRVLSTLRGAGPILFELIDAGFEESGEN